MVTRRILAKTDMLGRRNSPFAGPKLSLCKNSVSRDGISPILARMIYLVHCGMYSTPKGACSVEESASKGFQDTEGTS